MSHQHSNIAEQNVGRANDASSKMAPVYIQLRDLIIAAIIDRTYQEGAILPSVRGLAAKQGANPLTVAKAYQLFQDQGLITVRRGVGMFVAPGARARLLAQEQAIFRKEEWPAMIQRARRLELDPNRLLKELC